MEIKFFKNKKKFRKGGSGIKPDLYWKCILFMTFILILTSFAFGLYLFIKIDKEPILSITNTSVKDIVKKERIDKVSEYFFERQKKSTEILNSPSPIVDPSL